MWLPEALDDLERLFEFLLERDPAAAERAIRSIESGAESLTALPERGRPMGDETGRRELLIPFGAGAYVVRYRLHREDVVIIRVWHSREQNLSEGQSFSL
ncbi:MAG: plasmid stabilization protein [Candidatus Entotheonella gemina]|uniref:Plasmid stabilization protein n=1 Tax=Candidatus Entotheonella gemina TaxID=1429439 RepID=W4LJF6_9BACT|nr:MAG: plasmid stabilization protein [Candidatus Entotheonella gemina]